MKRFFASMVIATLLLVTVMVMIMQAQKMGKISTPAPAPEAPIAAEVEPVKYVFYFIGDGMSIPQRMMTEEYLHLTENRGLIMNSFEAQGYSTTYAADSFITDSAASGTALACGTKTNSGWLGVDPQKNRLESVAEVAKKSGRKVAIISSVTLNHATPAAFYAHNPSRGDAYPIALEIFDSNFDFFGGGTFINVDGKNVENAVNILDLAREKGWTVSTTHDEFNALAPSDKPILAITPRFGEEGSMPYSIDMKDGDITLADFVTKAIDVLDNDDGFFMSIEGGKIDWMCHANDAGTVLREVIALDDAIAVAVEFAKKHPDDTLIVVTGDHETGGLTLGFAGTGYKSYLERLKNQKASYVEMAPVYYELKKNKDTTFEDVKPIITQYTGMKFEGEAKDPMLLSSAEIKKLAEAFERSRGGGTYSEAEVKSVLYSGYDPLLITTFHTLNNKAGIAWTSFAHTALPVGTSATGKNAHKFANMSDNTDIANNLKPMLAPLK